MTIAGAASQDTEPVAARTAPNRAAVPLSTHLMAQVGRAEMGFADVRLLDQYEVRQLVPGIDEHITAGSYSPQDGQADPPATTLAFAAAAERFGAVYWKNTTVLSLITQGERIAGAQTDSGKILADHTVLSAGVWSDEIATTVGLRLPIRTTALQMLLSTPAAPGMLTPVLGVLNRALSLKQLADGAFLLGGGWPGDPSPDRRSYTLRPASMQGNWQTACTIMPQIAQQQMARAWCGLEAQSIDDIPFVGPVAGLDGLTLAVGFSGHGFALSPAVGRSVADQIAGGKPAPELEGLSPDRIATFPSEQVQEFLANKEQDTFYLSQVYMG